jgi:hypothetical protein
VAEAGTKFPITETPRELGGAKREPGPFKGR